MAGKAGHVFSCRCCGEEKPEDRAEFDNQLNGPVCPECKQDLRWAQAWLKKAEITRPLMERDLNEQVKKRLGME